VAGHGHPEVPVGLHQVLGEHRHEVILTTAAERLDCRRRSNVSVQTSRQVRASRSGTGSSPRSWSTSGPRRGLLGIADRLVNPVQTVTQCHVHLWIQVP
jgi:hypothetical protein